jgi:hypothetical protein
MKAEYLAYKESDTNNLLFVDEYFKDKAVEMWQSKN